MSDRMPTAFEVDQAEVEELQSHVRRQAERIAELEKELATAKGFHHLAVKERDLERVRVVRLEEAVSRCLSFLRNIPGHRRSDDVHDAICVLGQTVAPRDAGEAPGGQGKAT